MNHFITLLTDLKKKHILEIGWVLIGQFISILLGVISIKLLTTMGVDEFGKYSLVLTIVALLSLVFYGPVEQGFIRFYFDYLNQKAGRIFINLFYRFILIAGISCVYVGLIAIPISNRLQLSVKPLECLGIGLFVSISASTNMLNSMMNLLRKRKINTFLQVTEKGLIVLFLLVIAKVMKLNAITCLFTLTFSLSIVFIIKIKIFHKNIVSVGNNNGCININEVKEKRKEMIRVLKAFAIPFVIWGGTGWLQSNSERLVIANYLSIADVGCYAIMLTLTNFFITMPAGIINQLLLPLIYEKATQSNDLEKNKIGFKIVKYLTVVTIGLVFVSSVLTSIVGKQIIELISSAKYSSNWYMLPIMCIGAGFFNVGQSLTTLGLVMNRPHIYLFPKIASGIIALLFNILFVIKLGIIGIAVALCFSNLIYLILVLNVNYKKKQRLEWHSTIFN